MSSMSRLSMNYLIPEDYKDTGSIRSYDSRSSNYSPPVTHINTAYDYEDTCSSHDYEDLNSVRTAAKTGPRQKRNEVYETAEPVPRRERHITECSDASSAYSLGSDVTPVKRESWLSKLILFLILAFSVAALLLVILIILGKMGPKCSCTQAESSELPVPSTGRSVSVQNLLKRIQDLESSMKAMKEKMEARDHAVEVFVTKHEKQVELLQAQVSTQKRIVNETANKVAAVDGVWVNMSNTHKVFEMKLDAEFRLLNKSVKALNKNDGDLTSKINELRRNQILTEGISKRLAVNVTQLESRVQELKKSNTSVSSRAGSLERGYAQMSTFIRTLQAVNGAQNASHVYLQSLYNGVKDSLARVNATVNDKLKNPGGKAAADFKTCEHHTIRGVETTAGTYAVADAIYTEPSNKRVMGVACSTDNAARSKLFSDGNGFYRCDCNGVLATSSSDNPTKIQCFLHVWECPISS